MLKAFRESFVDAKALGAHHGENAHRVFENPFLVGDPQNAECAGQRKTTPLCDRPTLPFVHYQKVSVLFLGKLNCLRLALVEIGREFDVQRTG